MSTLGKPSHVVRENQAMISTRTFPESVASNGGLPEVTDETVRDLAQVFKLLADETRLRILFYLTRTPELHVRALCELLDQSQPAVSHHLALMRSAELIELRREGKHNFYHLVPQRFEQALGLLFANVPSENRRIRFGNFVLGRDGDET
jgi:ArsR family transcriptional regulator